MFSWPTQRETAGDGERFAKRIFFSGKQGGGKSVSLGMNLDQGAPTIHFQILTLEKRRVRVYSEGKDWQPLLRRVRREEAAAQEELVAQLWSQVAGRIHGLCPRRKTVEDLAQEVFTKIFSKLWQYRGGVFEAWVDQVTRRICYDALRKQKVRPEWTFTDVGDEVREAASEDEVADIDAAEVLADLFRKLPDEVAWLLREVELEERNIGEVAREMGWTSTATRLRLFRARKKLQSVFNESIPNQKR